MLKRLVIGLAVSALIAGAFPFAHVHASGPTYRAVCPPATPGHVQCFALVRSDLTAISPNAAPAAFPGYYVPSDLQAAYNLTATSAVSGTGQILADVLWFDDPTAESDMNHYRAAFGLPPCTTANGCFKKVNEAGGTTYPKPDRGAAGEISLDLDMFSAICPKCKIILVEASNNGDVNIGIAEYEAAKLGATVISNSYGGPESSADPLYDKYFYNHPGIPITASTGDTGYGPAYPATSPYVTAVGGTSLYKTSSVPRGWVETAWSCYSSSCTSLLGTGGTGSGCSALEPKPSWQTDTGCATRTEADVSAVADPKTGVAVYQTYGALFPGWAVYGGTSAAAPIVAGSYALAGNGASINNGSYAYSHTSALNDVLKGTNANPNAGCNYGSYLCTAGPGYDGPTGRGTPNGTGAF